MSLHISANKMKMFVDLIRCVKLSLNTLCSSVILPARRSWLLTRLRDEAGGGSRAAPVLFSSLLPNKGGADRSHLHEAAAQKLQQNSVSWCWKGIYTWKCFTFKTYSFCLQNVIILVYFFTFLR